MAGPRMIEFVSRARVSHTEVATLRRWRAKDAPLAIVEIRSTLGLPGRFLLIGTLIDGGEFVISRHRTKHAAERAAQPKKGKR